MSGMETTPGTEPIYRLITGPDDALLCERISKLIEQGYQLYGSPAICYDPQRGTIASQALIRAQRAA